VASIADAGEACDPGGVPDQPPDAEELSRIPTTALVVLVGPSGSGKSTWADAWFRPDQVVSSDRLRALVGTGVGDQRAGTDAFAILDDVVARRMKRGLLTVVDSLGFDDARRATWVEHANQNDRRAIAVAFDTPAKECRARNKARPEPVPSKAVTAQLARRDVVRPLLDEEFDEVLAPTPPVVVAATLTSANTRPRSTPDDAVLPKKPAARLRFGLHLSSFAWPGETTEIGPRLAQIAADAEDAGFDSIWVMDHMLQIPQVGREWEPMLESYSTLSFLAAATGRVRLGTLVTGITYRNIAHLAKIVATLDVLSSGRAECGLGAAWFEREHTAYGWRFPPPSERFELLEDALELLPLMWGPGAPAFNGRRIGPITATCYPRPVQDKIPILVGGSGEQRTLRLVARHADACNLFGEPDRIRQLVDRLHRHCATEERDPAEIRITQLSSILAASSPERLHARIEEMRGNAMPEQFIEEANAGLADHHVDRFEALADAGVDEVMVRLHDVGYEGALAEFAPIIAEFSRPTSP
jgi:F420-dependent oxidoreductase-like protein